MLPHSFRRFWGNCSPVTSIPVDAGRGWGWEAPRPGLVGCGRTRRRQKTHRKSAGPGGKTPEFEEIHQTCPRRDFSVGMGRLWCDPKVKLSALTGVVEIQIAAIRSWWRETLSFSLCKTR